LMMVALGIIVTAFIKKRSFAEVIGRED